MGLIKSFYNHDNEESFFANNDWDFSLESFSKRTITAIYFTFTTLSTVGFGDFYPKNDIERLIGSFVLLGGVATFSYIMGELLAMINNIGNIDNVVDIQDELEKFFNLLTYFNGGTYFSQSLTNEFSDHLEYIH